MDIDAWVKRVVETGRATAAERQTFPRATYRLQFQKDVMTFRRAAELTPYLRRLGVSHVYASPLFKARAGSGHGYDVVDHQSLNPELGGRDDFDHFVAAMRDNGLRLLLDIVPNHMAVGTDENAWWNDVLANGRGSPYAGHFDIDWRPVKQELRQKVLLPILGDQYGVLLEAGELQLVYRDGAFVLRCPGRTLPLDPATWDRVLAHRMESLEESLGDSQHLLEFQSILSAIRRLPDRNQTDAALVEERRRESRIIRQRLAQLRERSDDIRAFIDGNIQEFNGEPDDPRSFDRLDELLDAQAYRLSHWIAASDEINYRRFFDINDLAAVCMEDAEVFEDAHRLLYELLAADEVHGLRIDHIDGLLDPAEYLQRLQRRYVLALTKQAHDRLCAERDEGDEGEPPPDWAQIEPACREQIAHGLRAEGGASNASTQARPASPLYVLVEKILGPEEPLPAAWPTAGTTGYDVLNMINGLFVDADGWRELDKHYRRWTGKRGAFADTAYHCKTLVLRTHMASELHMLATQVNRLSERDRRFRDFTLNSLRAALRELLACFPVYRTYITPTQFGERDQRFLRAAVTDAKRRNPATDPALFDFLLGLLSRRGPIRLDARGDHDRDLFIGRFQQITSPVMAKGIEDTALYRDHPLSSVNEVGGEPGRPAMSPSLFHDDNLARLNHWPHGMVCTTTHDTKRSEDVRARINVLSEMPRLWRSTLQQWARLNRKHRREIEGLRAPSRNDENLFYQTLVGVWPIHPPDAEQLRVLIERLQQYLLKAAHEAKQRTSWTHPNAEYDKALSDFVADVLDEGNNARFMEAFRAFHERVLDCGLYTGLSQALLKLTAPGVPDVYQGQELWDFSLVDPDNRRPVDFAQRVAMLTALEELAEGGESSRRELTRTLGSRPRAERIKLWVTWRTLQFRAQHEMLFRQGEYVPLAARGSQATRLCAFARRAGQASRDAAVILAPRLLGGLMRVGAPDEQPRRPLGGAAWSDTHVELGDVVDGTLENVFTGQTFTPTDGRLALAEVLDEFPVALLTPR